MGFDLALNRAGHTAVAMVERDKACQGVLRRRFAGVPLFDDVTTFGKKDIPNATVDIVCGGSPCQSFSVAGLRKSLADQRGNLAFEFCRIVNEFKPAYVIWENVPGVLNTRDNAFGCFLAALVGEDSPLVPPRGKWTNAGLVAGPERSAAWRVLDAQYFGVAQRRRRVFVVASAASASRGCDEILFECEGVRRDTAPSRQTRESVASAIGARIARSHTDYVTSGEKMFDEKGIHREKLSDTVTPTLNAYDTPLTFRVVKPDAIAFAPGNLVRRAGENPSTEVFGTLGADKLGDMFPHVAQVYDACGNGAGDIAPNMTGDHANRITDYTPVVVQQNTRDEVRLVGGDGQIAGAISAESGMKQQNYVVQAARSTGAGYYTEDEVLIATVRRLTPTEAERLQAFPDGWTAQRATKAIFSTPETLGDEAEIVGWETTEQSDTPRYKQLGNAVCVNVVEFIARRITA